LIITRKKSISQAWNPAESTGFWVLGFNSEIANSFVSSFVVSPDYSGLVAFITTREFLILDILGPE
jgi:hypothetical protein